MTATNNSSDSNLVSHPPKKYILFCAQKANFQTRSMLIPYDEITKCEERVKDLQILRDNASHNVEFEHRGEKYVVDQLLVQNYTRNGNFAFADRMPFTQIIQDFTSYADGDTRGFDDEVGVLKECDWLWVPHIIVRVASEGFNNIANYCNFRFTSSCRSNPIEVVEGFLVLESRGGKLAMPPVDSVKEMFEKYFTPRRQ